MFNGFKELIKFAEEHKGDDAKIWGALIKFGQGEDTDSIDSSFKRACRAICSDAEYDDFLKKKLPPARKIGDVVSYNAGDTGWDAVVEGIEDTGEKEIRYLIGYSKGWGSHYLRDCHYTYLIRPKHGGPCLRYEGNWVN